MVPVVFIFYQGRVFGWGRSVRIGDYIELTIYSRVVIPAGSGLTGKSHSVASVSNIISAPGSLASIERGMLESDASLDRLSIYYKQFFLT